MRRSLDASLERLGLDHVDVLLLHDPDDYVEEAISTAYPELARMRAKGIVGAIGVGMNRADLLTCFVERTDIDVVMCAGRYTLLEQPALDDLLPACDHHGISVVVAGVFNSGLLASPQVADEAMYDYAVAPASGSFLASSL
jgi:D-threo-aldose 1-dehydrogenase